MWRSVTLRVLVALMMAGGASCGLPTIPFLDPPLPPQDSLTNDILYFRHNPNNDIDDFQGYELYYKLYTQDQEELLEEDANTIAAEPRQPGPSRLTAQGFVRAVAVAVHEFDPDDPFREIKNDQKPHIPTTPTGSNILYEIDLSDPLNADPNADILVSWQDGNRKRGFRRRTTQAPTFGNLIDETKSFWNREGYSPNDDDDWDWDWDIRQMRLSDELESETPPRTFYIVWYVLSYGVDGTNFSTNLYSEPLRLEPSSDFAAELQLR